jgi:hypothetical protein
MFGESMKLNYQEIDEINAALTTLPLKGTSVLNSAINMVKLKQYIDTIVLLKTKLIKKYSDGKETISSEHENWGLFLEDYNAAIKEEIEISDLIPLSKEDLDFSNLTQPAGAKTTLQMSVATLLSRGLLV